MANQHVVPNSGHWQVKRENATKATKNFTTQKEAISYARSIANNQQSELIIHGRNSQIRDKDSYGNDPHPPKDTRH
jgi:hypothetical protein